ncbi:MAG: hypothetical protein KatS3mg078_1980 [Deltaproteobacteria bacterium]|nr:MAG: hypothetical protein KatS3mg078_1980 [Deltaproteobacteria bacterium]
MKSVLLIVAFTLAFTMIFLLDVLGKRRRRRAKYLYKKAFDVFNRINWNMSAAQVKDVFKGREFFDYRERKGILFVGYRDNHNGLDTAVSFCFVNGGERLVRVKFVFFGISKIDVDLIFERLCSLHGLPLPPDRGSEAVWDLKEGFLILRGLGAQVQLILRNKGYEYDGLIQEKPTLGFK